MGIVQREDNNRIDALADELLIYAKAQELRYVDPELTPNLRSMYGVAGDDADQLIAVDTLLREATTKLSNQDDLSADHRFDRWCAEVLLHLDPDTSGVSFTRRCLVIERRLGLSEKGYFNAKSRGPRLLRDVAIELLRTERAARGLGHDQPAEVPVMPRRGSDGGRDHEPSSKPPPGQSKTSIPATAAGPLGTQAQVSRPDRIRLNESENSPSKRSSRAAHLRRVGVFVGVSLVLAALLGGVALVLGDSRDDRPKNETHSAIEGIPFRSSGIDVLVATPWVTDFLGDDSAVELAPARFVIFPLRIENQTADPQSLAKWSFTLRVDGKLFKPESTDEVPLGFDSTELQPDQVAYRTLTFRAPSDDFPPAAVLVLDSVKSARKTRHVIEVFNPFSRPLALAGGFRGGSKSHDNWVQLRIVSRHFEKTVRDVVTSVEIRGKAGDTECVFKFDDPSIRTSWDKGKFRVRGKGLDLTGRYDTSFRISGSFKARQVAASGQTCVTPNRVTYSAVRWPTRSQLLAPAGPGG